MHRSGWTREVRGRMIRSIDGEYKRIEILTENLSQVLSQSTQTRSVDEKGSELLTLNFVTQVCFVRVQASQKMSARKSHGDGSDCPLCSLHDGDLSSLQGGQRLSLFGNKIQKNNFSEALKTGLETSQTLQKLPLEAASGEDTPRDRFWTSFGPDFESDVEL